MIIIDTIRRALPGKDFNKDGALFDDILSQLQTLAQQNHIAIVVRPAHPQEHVPASTPTRSTTCWARTGLTASADCVLALYTEQGKKGAVLKGPRARPGRHRPGAGVRPAHLRLAEPGGDAGRREIKESGEEILECWRIWARRKSHTIAKNARQGLFEYAQASCHALDCRKDQEGDH